MPDEKMKGAPREVIDCADCGAKFLGKNTKEQPLCDECVAKKERNAQ